MNDHQLSLPIEAFMAAAEQEQLQWERSSESQFIDAVHSGDMPRIKALWAQGINVRKMTWQWGESPLECAIEQDNVAVVKTLLELGLDPYYGLFDLPLTLAITKGSVEIILAFIEAGMDVNRNVESEPGRWTPLMCAAHFGQLEIAKILIKNGADLDARIEEDWNMTTRGGWTALTYAACQGHIEIVKLLVGHGADVDVVTAEGRTAFDYAIEQGNTAIFNYLF
ncbi:MAG: ankyrin repeat domain-containing protein [Spirulina sp. SIO3F2]|nr:ankyrin repeat domain-containing protein [Spirulina sp. SIO3F2]